MVLRTIGAVALSLGKLADMNVVVLADSGMALLPEADVLLVADLAIVLLADPVDEPGAEFTLGSGNRCGHDGTFHVIC